jgi:hypothetical protein
MLSKAGESEWFLATLKALVTCVTVFDANFTSS